MDERTRRFRGEMIEDLIFIVADAESYVRQQALMQLSQIGIDFGGTPPLHQLDDTFKPE